jgi:uncharacterized protein YlzI (FlbEa/FlbD family)
MISLHHIDGNEFYLSARVKLIEPGADTVVHLMDGDIFRVQESAEEVVEKVREWEISIRTTVRVAKPAEES